MVSTVSEQHPSLEHFEYVLNRLIEIQQEYCESEKKEDNSNPTADLTLNPLFCIKEQSGDASSDKKESRSDKKKKIETLNEIERTVDVSGKTGSVVVPKAWAGKRVKIMVVESGD
jgi:putative transposon-encoded protein